MRFSSEDEHSESGNSNPIFPFHTDLLELGSESPPAIREAWDFSQTVQIDASGGIHGYPASLTQQSEGRQYPPEALHESVPLVEIVFPNVPSKRFVDILRYESGSNNAIRVGLLPGLYEFSFFGPGKPWPGSIQQVGESRVLLQFAPPAEATINDFLHIEVAKIGTNKMSLIEFIHVRHPADV